MRDPPSKKSLLIRPGLPLENLSIINETHIICRTALQQWLNDNMQLNMSSLVRLARGPEKTMESDQVLEKTQAQLNINFCGIVNVVTTDMNYNLTTFMLFLFQKL